MALDAGGLGDLGWWDAGSPDLIGGDGSDDDIQLIAQQAATDAINALFSTCSNSGMQVMAEMISDVIQSQAEGLPDGEEPDEDGMLEAIAGVHSSDTAESCMREGCELAASILMQALDVIREHEAAEGETI